MDSVARMGPNAILQVGAALDQLLGSGARVRFYRSAGLEGYLREPPGHMVPETEVQALHAALRAELPVPTVRELALRAGAATGDYLLAHRIPKPVQALLKALPAALAARVLLSAISRHAWTFAGSGRFSCRAGRPVVLEIRDNPLARNVETAEPCCAFYTATFERLFRTLVRADAQVVEVACEACGDDACRFEVRW